MSFVDGDGVLARPSNSDLATEKLCLVKDGDHAGGNSSTLKQDEAIVPRLWNGDLANCWAQVWVKFRDFNCCRLEQFAHNLLVHHPSGQVSEVHFTKDIRHPFLGLFPFSGRRRKQQPLFTKRLNIKACELSIVRRLVALRPSNPDGPVLKLEPTHLHSSRCEDIIHELHKCKHPFALRREVKGTYDVDNVWVSLHETGKR